MTEDDHDLPILKFEKDDEHIIDSILSSRRAIAGKQSFSPDSKTHLAYFAGLLRRLPRIHDNFPAILSLTKNFDESWASHEVIFTEGAFRLTTSEGWRSPAGHEYQNYEILVVSETSRTTGDYCSLEEWIMTFQDFSEDESVEASLEWEHDEEDCCFLLGDRFGRDWEQLLDPANKTIPITEEMSFEDDESEEPPPEHFPFLIEEMPEVERLAQALRSGCALPSTSPEDISSLSKLVYAIERLPLPTEGIDTHLELRSTHENGESTLQSLRISEETFSLQSAAVIITNPTLGSDAQQTSYLELNTEGYREIHQENALTYWINEFEERIQNNNALTVLDSSDENFDFLQPQETDGWEHLKSQL